ncbi:uncharacterized protein LOC143032025 [Oratosquilla oratoria]|uniref:uncharacterized protein LOC143032025 n=1 Tax=Oratosquilla oratoria TaxID=337810 RepID=UPI003F757712
MCEKHTSSGQCRIKESSDSMTAQTMVRSWRMLGSLLTTTWLINAVATDTTLGVAHHQDLVDGLPTASSFLPFVGARGGEHIFEVETSGEEEEQVTWSVGPMEEEPPTPTPDELPAGISLTTSAPNNATISQTEFDRIITQITIDTLQATQIANRLGLSLDAAEENSNMALERSWRADLMSQSSNDRPTALPFGQPVLQRRMGLPPQHEGGLTQSTKRLFFGDPTLCYTGTCQFFLICWLNGGLIDGGCGGFLFACCSHGNTRSEQSYRDDSHGIIPVNYGPIRNDPGCGLSGHSRIGAQRRIVGGTEAGFGTFPWQAYIRIGSSRCGGSLINEMYVITAGHCVARARPHQVRVTLGDYVLNTDREPLPPKIFGATEIKVHPQFKFTPQADRYDVAVIRLDHPVHFEPHVQPICLPEKGATWLGQFAWAAGWGALQAGSRLRPKTLQVVDVPILDSRICEDWHRTKGINVVIYDEMMCAGYGHGGKDSCQGDSGGPLMVQDDGRWFLAGIVSAGYSCAQNKQPGIYHKVSYTSDWISWAAST